MQLLRTDSGATSVRASLFVNPWSEPLEPVRWQVSSGRTHEPTRRWLGPDRADRIRVFGFEIGGDAEDFQHFSSSTRSTTSPPSLVSWSIFSIPPSTIVASGR
jgi:hypothetical protein